MITGKRLDTTAVALGSQIRTVGYPRLAWFSGRVIFKRGFGLVKFCTRNAFYFYFTGFAEHRYTSNYRRITAAIVFKWCA